MSKETSVYIHELDNLRSEVTSIIHNMATEELNTAPVKEGSNSPAALATHISGSEQFWIHQVVGGIDVGRDRDSEFTANADSPAALERLLEKTGNTSRGIIHSLSGDDLAKLKVARPGEEPITLRSAILHQIAHMAQHLGHLDITKQIYNADK